jgi:hypothetical protein
VFEVARTNTEHLSRTIEEILGLVDSPGIEIPHWEASRYKPTPTIIETTLALYRGHSVTEISRADAGATNLGITAGSSTGSASFGDADFRFKHVVVGFGGHALEITLNQRVQGSSP